MTRSAATRFGPCAATEEKMHVTALETVDNRPSAPVAHPILLDSPLSRMVLDVLGAITLFASIALALTVRDAIVATVAVGSLVIASRALRMRTHRRY